MSIINKMLRDLDARGEPSEATGEYGPVFYQDRAWYQRPWVWLLLALLIAAGLLVWRQWPSAQLQPVKASQVSKNSAEDVAAPNQQASASSPATANEPLADTPTAAKAAIEAETPALRDRTEPAAVTVSASKAEPEPKPKAEPRAQDNPAVDEQVSSKSTELSVQRVQLTTAELLEKSLQQAEQAKQAGDLDKALQYLQQAVSVAPDNSKARERYAALLYGRGYGIQAQRVLAEGLQRHPDNIRWRMMLAQLVAENQGEGPALAILKQQQPAIAEEQGFYQYRAKLAQSQQDFQQSLADYQQLADFQPQQPRWWLGVAISADRLQQVDTARAAYQQVLALSHHAPTIDFASQRLAQLRGK